MFAFIYSLCGPDGKVRYVGKSIAPVRRVKYHCGEKGVTRKCRWISSLAKRNEKPTLEILAKVDERFWQEAERWWIKLFRSFGADLTNHTIGGEGVTGLDAEARSRVSALAKVRMNDLAFRKRIYTPERNRKISKALTGLVKAPEHVAKLPQNRPGWHHTEASKIKIQVNGRGHRWNKEEAALLRLQNIGNQYGLGNRSKTGLKNSPETNKKISRFWAGRKKTKIQRKRMSLARKEWWKRRKENVELSYRGGSSSSKSYSAGKA